jgi:hypothetical protein
LNLKILGVEVEAVKVLTRRDEEEEQEAQQKFHDDLFLIVDGVVIDCGLVVVDICGCRSKISSLLMRLQ